MLAGRLVAISFPSTAATLVIAQQRDRQVLKLLAGDGLLSLGMLQILDVGLRFGPWLPEFVNSGADPALVSGVDLPRLPHEKRPAFVAYGRQVCAWLRPRFYPLRPKPSI